MRNFIFDNSTRVIFGKDSERQLGTEIKKYSEKVMLHYGGGSIKKNGIYEKVVKILEEKGIEIIEFGGVKPNPNLKTIYEGIKICRENDIDFILAVGGGSAIDSAKAIAAGVKYEGDVWDFYEKHLPIKEALPLGVVLTIPAAGSETSTATVITNEEKNLKIGTGSLVLRPKFAIMNPEFTFTLPPYQTAAGIVDMMAHIMERYFTRDRNVDFTDKVSEAALKSIIKNAAKVIDSPEDYDARAEIMWAGTMAHNDILGVGRQSDWATHAIEHQLSALYDLTHGAGLAIMFPAWITYVKDEYIEKIMQFFHNVFDVEAEFEYPEKMVEEGIKRLKAFYKSIGMPTNLEEAGITDDRFIEMAKLCTRNGTVGSFRKLDEEDVIEIYKLARK